MAFVLGLLLSPWLWSLQTTSPNIQIHTPQWLIIISGLLVGIGTRLGSGCTSGHGICGLSRLSKRSLVATMVFMVVAMLTTFVLKHWMAI